MADSQQALLCVANFPSNTGYAWNFIEGLFAQVADKLAKEGIATWVSYPKIESNPETLNGSAAQGVQLDASLRTLKSLIATLQFIRKRNIEVLYLTDRAPQSLIYISLRLAGVSKIVVHDHTSGHRTLPSFPKRVIKRLLNSIPGVCADVVVTVSDYVTRRQLEVALVPPDRVVRIWNSVRLPVMRANHNRKHSSELGIPRGRPLIVCACRATVEKGVKHLLCAFDSFVSSIPTSTTIPYLAYLGGGPQLQGLIELRETLRSKEHILIAGFRPDASLIVAEADLCIVPSVWEEAFGLAALEAMAFGKPVIASNVGGIPELIVDGVSGLLVSPGSESALSQAIRKLIEDPAAAKQMGQYARRRAEDLFQSQDKVEALTQILRSGFSI